MWILDCWSHSVWKIPVQLHNSSLIAHYSWCWQKFKHWKTQPRCFFISPHMCLPQVFVSDTFTVKNQLAQMLAGVVCLEAFGTLGVLRIEKFQLQTCCQYYLKISEWYIITAVCIPGWALLPLGPFSSQRGHRQTRDLMWNSNTDL